MAHFKKFKNKYKKTYVILFFVHRCRPHKYKKEILEQGVCTRSEKNRLDILVMKNRPKNVIRKKRKIEEYFIALFISCDKVKISTSIICTPQIQG